MFNVKKAVIPAAGLGTRFLPATKAVPKPMLPILDKPIIQYIAEELDDAGIEEIIIVVSPDSGVIKGHFGKADSLEERLEIDGKKELLKICQKAHSFNVKFVEQKVANGLAGAILCAEEYLKGEPFALLLGDELLTAEQGETSCIKHLINVFNKTGKSIIATMEVFGDDVSKYGNIGVGEERDGYMVATGIVEKPALQDALSNYAIIGRYVLSGETVEKIKKLVPRKGELYLTDVLDEYAKGGKLLASGFEGKRFDAGDKFGYIKANVEMALKSKEIGQDVKDFIINLASKLK